MTDLNEVVVRVVEKLEACGISYMIVGSHASNSHGIPRATNDADMVVEIEPKKIDEFSAALGDEFYFDIVAAKEALKLGVMFNIIHYETGFKIDLIFLGNQRFSQEEFKRRHLATFAGNAGLRRQRIRFLQNWIGRRKANPNASFSMPSTLRKFKPRISTSIIFAIGRQI